MPRFERHLFVCTNLRAEGDPRGSCAAGGSEVIRAAFKQRLAAAGLNDRMRANSAGCLDACEHGPTVVVYPEQVWYGGVSLAEVDEIIECHLLGGDPVERLRIRAPESTPVAPPAADGEA